MVDLELSADQQLLVETTRDFMSREFAPTIQQNDIDHYYDPSTFSKLAGIGLTGICFPERYGGAGMDYLSLGIVCEELEYVDTHLRVIMSVHVGLNCLTLWCWGNDQQRKKYLAPQARGEKIATYGLTEPNAGSDAVGIQSTAVRKGDRYVLNGESIWATQTRDNQGFHAESLPAQFVRLSPVLFSDPFFAGPVFCARRANGLEIRPPRSARSSSATSPTTCRP